MMVDMAAKSAAREVAKIDAHAAKGEACARQGDPSRPPDREAAGRRQPWASSRAGLRSWWADGLLAGLPREAGIIAPPEAGG